MEELTRFGMNNSITLPTLAKRYFISLRDENDEPIYTYNDEFVRHFVIESIKGGRCSALNQFYKSTFSEKIFNFFSKELDIPGNLCEFLDKYFEYTNKPRKLLENEYDSQFEDHRDINQVERINYIISCQTY